jgi:hypothetical protein
MFAFEIFKSKMKHKILVFAIVFAFLDFIQSTEEISSLAYREESPKRMVGKVHAVPTVRNASKITFKFERLSV